VGLLIANCQLPIADCRLAKYQLAIGNRQLAMEETDSLPQGVTNFIGSPPIYLPDPDGLEELRQTP
jgi:hypothetical protein